MMSTSELFGTPILLLIFNRPDPTRLVFEEIRKIRPAQLFVAADGPRQDKPDEAELCATTRQIISSVDWECDVKVLFRESNLGCGRAVSEAITWFFNQVEEGIILEDDCQPAQSFFPFCQEVLERYRTDSRIMHVGGTNFIGESAANKEYSYYFSRYGNVWGWATWRRAWEKYDFELSTYEYMKKMKMFDKFFFNKIEKSYRLNKLDETYEKKIDTWDYQWEYTLFVQSGLCVIPRRNLIKNLGFGEGATHTYNAVDANADMKVSEIEFPLDHPTMIIRDIKNDKIFFDDFVRKKISSKLRYFSTLLGKKTSAQA